jgi:two-component system, CitB family, sensor kinase
LRLFFFVSALESVLSILATTSASLMRRTIRKMTSERRHLWGRLRLSTQILLLQLAIIVLTLGMGVAVSIVQARSQLDRQSGRQSLAIARTVAQMPEILGAFRKTHPERIIDPIAERIRGATGASFVVVANRHGIRYSHPDPQKIGQPISTDPSEVLSGNEFVGVQTGSLGRSVRGKVPIRDDRGRIIGLVSVGFLESKISAQLRDDLPVLLIPPAIGLGLGVLGSFLLARRIKRQTFGLEPNEIAGLLEQREAMLHGIREGTVATDKSGRMTLVNDEAKRLLEIDDSAIGRQLTDIVPAGHAREVLAGNIDQPDQIVLVNDRILVANRMPVNVRGRAVGAVVTLRDRTELDKLMRELNDVRSLADALRAQEHEFSHRLHVVAGLIELGRNDEAVRYINHSSLVHQALVASIVESIGEPTIVALLLGKAAVASERGIELRVTEDTRLPEDYPGARDLVTVVGNLVDNALDSVASALGSGWIEVTIRDEADGVLIQVRDSGPGVDPEIVDEIFRDGFTTKVATGTGRRGLGLALVSQTVRRRPGGFVNVTNEGGALFKAFLPHDAATVDAMGVA